MRFPEGMVRGDQQLLGWHWCLPLVGAKLQVGARDEIVCMDSEQLQKGEDYLELVAMRWEVMRWEVRELVGAVCMDLYLECR